MIQDFEFGVFSSTIGHFKAKFDAVKSKFGLLNEKFWKALSDFVTLQEIIKNEIFIKGSHLVQAKKSQCSLKVQWTHENF